MCVRACVYVRNVRNENAKFARRQVDRKTNGSYIHRIYILITNYRANIYTDMLWYRSSRSTTFEGMLPSEEDVSNFGEMVFRNYLNYCCCNIEISISLGRNSCVIITFKSQTFLFFFLLFKRRISFHFFSFSLLRILELM